MDKLINMDLISNPLNWVIVLLLCSFALAFLAIVSPQT